MSNMIGNCQFQGFCFNNNYRIDFYSEQHKIVGYVYKKSVFGYENAPFQVLSERNIFLYSENSIHDGERMYYGLDIEPLFKCFDQLPFAPKVYALSTFERRNLSIFTNPSNGRIDCMSIGPLKSN